MIKLTVNVVQIILLVSAVTGTVRCLKLKQRRTIALCCCCVAIFSLLSLKFTHEFVGLKEEITITALNKKCEESKGTEVDIQNLRMDGDVITAYDVIQGHWYTISNRYSWRPPEDERWDGTATDYITLKVPVGWARSVQFHGNAWRGYVAVEKPDGTTEIVNTYSEESQIYSCWIGRSDTRLLLCNGIINIFSYAMVLGILSGLLIWIIKKSGLKESIKEQTDIVHKREKSDMKKRWMVSVLLTGVLALLMVICSVANLRERVKTDAVILASAAQTESAPITASDRYIQTFTSNGTFNQMQLQFCSYGRENQSTTIIQLMEPSTGNVLEHWEVDNSSVSKNAVTFALQEEQGKGEYQLVVEGRNPDAETSIGIYLQDRAVYAGELWISGEEQTQNISIGLYQKTNLGYVMLTAVLSAAVFCTWIAFALIFIWKPALWKTAFCLITCFGCVYLAVFPAGCVNDSWRHYVTAYQYSNELLGIEPSMAGTVMMRKEDCDEFRRYRGLDRAGSLSTYFEEADEFSMWCQDSTLSDCGEKSLTTGSAASSIAYFPQILGLTLGRIFSLGTVPCMFFARFLQLLTVAVLVSIAVKWIPTGKELLLLLALLPIFQQQITAFSYDGIAFGFAFLWISIWAKLRTKIERISIPEFICFLMSTVGLCACRGGMYIFLLILLAVIPRQVFGNKEKSFLLGISIFTVLSVFSGTYFGASSALSSKSGLLWGSPLRHPIDVCLHFLSSIIENIDVYWSGSFGQQMGWSQGLVPHAIVFGFIVMLLIISLSDDNSDGDCIEIPDVKSRIIYLIPIVLVLGFCLGTMYIGEAHRATKWNIWGVQGRYLIPVLPLVFFQVKNRFVVMKENIRPAIVYSFCVWEVVEIFYLMRTFVTR